MINDKKMQLKRTTDMKTQGFTLIELSIVLVIIGLLAGGILVGRELILAAELRAQISQIEKFKTAIKTFRLKYNGLPGDLVASEANAYGFASGNGSYGHSDGNGIIIACDDISNAEYGCETGLFWNHLAIANLIPGPFGSTITSACNGDWFGGCTNSVLGVSGGTQGAPITNYLPQGAIGRGSFVHAYSSGSYMILQLFGMTGFNGANAWNLFYLLTPNEAYNIDSKIDDGMPTTGYVQGSFSLEYAGFSGGYGIGNDDTPNNNGNPGFISCLNETAVPYVYDLKNANGTGETPECNLYFVISMQP